jgi:hypothetical protein
MNHEVTCQRVAWRIVVTDPLAVDRDFSKEEVSMARFFFPKLDVLKIHRGWEDWLLTGLGALLLLTPALVQGEMPPPVLFSSLAVGVVITAMALFEIMLKGRWEEIIQFVLGVWLAVSVFILDYGIAFELRALHFAIGALVALMAAFEFWQDSLKKS